MFDKKAYMKQYWAEHRDQHRETMRRWRAEHPERVKELAHEQYLKRKAAKQKADEDNG